MVIAMVGSTPLKLAEKYQNTLKCLVYRKYQHLVRKSSWYSKTTKKTTWLISIIVIGSVGFWKTKERFRIFLLLHLLYMLTTKFWLSRFKRSQCFHRQKALSRPQKTKKKLETLQEISSSWDSQFTEILQNLSMKLNSEYTPPKFFRSCHIVFFLIADCRNFGISQETWMQWVLVGIQIRRNTVL